MSIYLCHPLVDLKIYLRRHCLGIPKKRQSPKLKQALKMAMLLATR
jgi:hypothetical protein